MLKAPTRIDDEDEEYIEQLEALSPLTALDADAVDSLTVRQQAFLLSFLNTGSIVVAKKAQSVSPKMWADWQADEHFADLFATVKSPVKLAMTNVNMIIMRATQEHMKMFSHEKTSVRQWAVERAYNLKSLLQPVEDPKNRGKNPDASLTQENVRALTAGLIEGLDEAERRRLERPSPFAVIDAPFTVQDSVQEKEVPIGSQES